MLTESIVIPNTQVLVASLIKWTPQDNADCKTEFVTDRTQSIQVGVLHRPSGTTVEAHQHLPVVKEVTGCQEVLIVRSGHIDVDIYGPDKAFICARSLKTGDIYIQYCGGHAFHFQVNTQFVEIKQGPYTPADKVYFNPLAYEGVR